MHSLYYNNKLGSKPLHLLGAALPGEFVSYQNNYGKLLGIESIDTSNPVVYGILKGRYPSHVAELTTKISTKLKDLITTNYSPKLVADCILNIEQFRSQTGL